MRRWVTFALITAALVANHVYCGQSRSSESRSGSECGRSEPLGRIINGDKIDKLHIPWIVWVSSISINEDGRSEMLQCGGSILSNNIILTAAHCLKRRNNILVKVIVYYNTSEALHGPKSYVNRVIVHPQYKNVNMGYDIALMSLVEPLRYDAYVRPICLPKKARTLDETPALASGWGYTNPAGNPSRNLLYVVLKVLPDQKCKSALYDTEAWKVSSSMLLCTHTPGKDICMGDSGGPLTVWNENGLSEVVGIVSFTFECGSHRYPSGFTRVSAFTEWIDNSIKSPQNWKELPVAFID